MKNNKYKRTLFQREYISCVPTTKNKYVGFAVNREIQFLLRMLADEIQYHTSI